MSDNNNSLDQTTIKQADDYQADQTDSNWEETVKNAGERSNNSLSEFVVSTILFVFGIFVIIGGVRMPSQVLSGNAWYVAPGVFPVLMGAILCILTLGTSIKSWKKHAAEKASGEKQVSDFWTKEHIINMLVITVLLIAYVFLHGVIPYRILTFAFLAVTTIFFDVKRTKKHIAVDLAVSLAVTLIVAYAFESLAKIPLP